MRRTNLRQKKKKKKNHLQGGKFYEEPRNAKHPLSGQEQAAESIEEDQK